MWLLLAIVVLNVSAQELSVVWMGRDTIRAARLELAGTWQLGATELEAVCEIIAGTKPVIGLIPRGLRVDVAARHYVSWQNIRIDAGIAHTSTHHIDTWAHRQRWGAIYGDWRMQLVLRVEEHSSWTELGVECVPYRALYAPNYVVGLPRWWTFARARLQAAAFDGRARARMALDAEVAEFRFELGAATEKLWVGLFVELLTHDWWEPARHAHAWGLALRVK